MTFFAIQGFMTESSTLRMSTYSDGFSGLLQSVNCTRHLCVELGRELHRLHELLFLVPKPDVLARRGALERVHGYCAALRRCSNSLMFYIVSVERVPQPLFASGGSLVLVPLRIVGFNSCSSYESAANAFYSLSCVLSLATLE